MAANLSGGGGGGGGGLTDYAIAWLLAGHHSGPDISSHCIDPLALKYSGPCNKNVDTSRVDTVLWLLPLFNV